MLAHDSFTQMGGAERVIDVLHGMFPKAVVYTLVIDKRLRNRYQNWEIGPSWLQYFYNLIPKLQYWLFLIPWAVSSINIKDADVVMSSSSGFVKNIKVPKKCIHINYCNTPTRFLWIDKDYVAHEVPFLLRSIVRIFLQWMKSWDLRGAKRVDYFIANSKEVQDRIQRIYNRTSTIIYPPINVDFWRPTVTKQDYFLVAGRLQAHKKIDFVVRCFNELGLPLHVVGIGRQEKYLKFIAKPNIQFFGQVSDEKLRDEYSGALAFVYPQIEDFGLMPLEAAACGTATIGIAKGGNFETITPGVTGKLFDNYDQREIKALILNWNPHDFKTDELRRHAEKFSRQNFVENLTNYIHAHCH